MGKMERMDKRRADKAVVDALTADGLLPGGTSVPIYCADRGQHSRTTFGTASSLTGRPPYLWLPVSRLGGSGPSRGLYVDRGCVNVRCPRCARHVRWRVAKADAIIEKLIAAGRCELDVSLV